jgi:transposase
VADIPAENIIFMDETWANTKMSLSYGWAPSHLRAYGVVPQGHFVQVSMVAAVCRSGVFAEHSFVGSMNGGRFYEWVAEYLVPHLTEGDVLIMDNLSSHKNRAAVSLIESVGARVLFLPPYSPDLNPIELVWSKMKSFFRSVGERSVGSLLSVFRGAVSYISPEDCAAFSRHCGYHT